MIDLPEYEAEKALGAFDGEVVQIWTNSGSMNDGWRPAVKASGLFQILDQYENSFICAVGSAEFWIDTGIVVDVKKTEDDHGLWSAEITFPTAQLNISYPMPRPVRDSADA